MTAEQEPQNPGARKKMTPAEREAEVLRYKEEGNGCVRQEKYEEAMFHYTHGLKLDPQNYSLYSNRSYVFLKLQQYHYAMEDALMTIHLKPDWTKGYFRKAEIESQTFRFTEAVQSYERALALQPNDADIRQALLRASRSLIKDERADQQIPWLGAGVGIIFGVIIVIADYVFTNKPTLTHPVLMALLTMAIAMLGFGIAKGFRYFVKCQRKSLLEPPIDLLDEPSKLSGQSSSNDSDKYPEKERHPNYTKAQARQRFKKGKS